MELQSSDFVLIVDDNPANLAVLAQTLKSAGCSVRVAVDGESAIQQAAEELPSLILLDIMMPGIDGFETCRRLKENPATCEVPIVFMTVLDEPEKKVQGLSLGAIDYVTKPFNESEVLVRVLSHLKTHHLLQTVQDQNQQLKREIAQRQKVEQQLRDLNNELQKTQIRLLQQEKLSAVAELVTGIVSEINSPVGCVAGNIEFIQEYSEKLLNHVALYQDRYSAYDSAIDQHAKQIELDYINRDLPAVVRSIQASTDRITAISKFIQVFNRLDIQQNQKHTFSIPELLDGALLILRHRLKAQDNRAAIEVTRIYDDLPKVQCFPGQLSQAFTNVLSIIIDAFDEHYATATDASAALLDPPRGRPPLQIQVKAEREAAQVVIRIRGNVGEGEGSGAAIAATDDHAPEAVREHAELGLLIARQIVVDTHRGELHSTRAANAEIVVKLPIRDSE